MPFKGMIRWGALALAGVAAALLLRAFWYGAKITRFERARVPAGALEEARQAIPGLREVTLQTSDGLALRGWFAPGSNRGLVILVHGGGGNRLSLLPEARVIARHGYGILLFDSRAHGESDGDLVSWGDREQRDVFAALDFTSASPEVDPGRVAVLGFSIGGSTAALAAARDQRLSAVLLYATWTSLEEELRTNQRRIWGPLSVWAALFLVRRAGVDLSNVRPVDHLREIAPRPLLMISGGLDTDTPPPVMRRLFAAASEPKELWFLEKAWHGGYLEVAPAEYEARVVGFLDRALLRAEAPPASSPRAP
jgi:dipeptidyl aminopeptidase/acylaminoacyl peptidase